MIINLFLPYHKKTIDEIRTKPKNNIKMYKIK